MKTFSNMKQPEGSLYCGPYCMVACLESIGKLPLKSPVELKQYDSIQKDFCGSSVVVGYKQHPTDLAIELYKVTGIITPGENPRYIEHSGYNSLGAMLYVLEQFGMGCEVVIRDRSTYQYLTSVFSVEFELIEKLGIPIAILDQNPSTLDSTMLISVISVNESLHYIANNAQGQWFDSHFEESVAYWDFIENWSVSKNKREGAIWLGVSIRISV